MTGQTDTALDECMESVVDIVARELYHDILEHLQNEDKEIFTKEELKQLLLKIF